MALHRSAEARRGRIQDRRGQRSALRGTQHLAESRVDSCYIDDSTPDERYQRNSFRAVWERASSTRVDSTNLARRLSTKQRSLCSNLTASRRNYKTEWTFSISVAAGAPSPSSLPRYTPSPPLRLTPALISCLHRNTRIRKSPPCPIPRRRRSSSTNKLPSADSRTSRSSPATSKSMISGVLEGSQFSLSSAFRLQLIVVESQLRPNHHYRDDGAHEELRGPPGQDLDLAQVEQGCERWRSVVVYSHLLSHDYSVSRILLDSPSYLYSPSWTELTFEFRRCRYHFEENDGWMSKVSLVSSSSRDLDTTVLATIVRQILIFPFSTELLLWFVPRPYEFRSSQYGCFKAD